MVTDFWYQSADAISAQLEAARDGLVPLGTTNVGNLTGDGALRRLGPGPCRQYRSRRHPVLHRRRRHDRVRHQLRAGLPGRSGRARLSERRHDHRRQLRRRQVRRRRSTPTFNRVELDGYNLGAYAAFNSGSFFFNAIAKVDWVDVEFDARRRHPRRI